MRRRWVRDPRALLSPPTAAGGRAQVDRGLGASLQCVLASLGARASPHRVPGAVFARSASGAARTGRRDSEDGPGAARRERPPRTLPPRGHELLRLGTWSGDVVGVSAVRTRLITTFEHWLDLSTFLEAHDLLLDARNLAAALGVVAKQQWTNAVLVRSLLERTLQHLRFQSHEFEPRQLAFLPHSLARLQPLFARSPALAALAEQVTDRIVALAIPRLPRFNPIEASVLVWSLALRKRYEPRLLDEVAARLLGPDGHAASPHAALWVPRSPSADAAAAGHGARVEGAPWTEGWGPLGDPADDATNSTSTTPATTTLYPPATPSSGPAAPLSASGAGGWGGGFFASTGASRGPTPRSAAGLASAGPRGLARADASVDTSADLNVDAIAVLVDQPHAAANLLWGFARFKHGSPRLLRRMLQQLRWQIDACAPQQLISVLWSTAMLRFTDRVFVEAACDRLARSPVLPVATPASPLAHIADHVEGLDGDDELEEAALSSTTTPPSLSSSSSSSSSASSSSSSSSLEVWSSVDAASVLHLLWALQEHNVRPAGLLRLLVGRLERGGWATLRPQQIEDVVLALAKLRALSDTLGRQLARRACDFSLLRAANESEPYTDDIDDAVAAGSRSSSMATRRPDGRAERVSSRGRGAAQLRTLSAVSWGLSLATVRDEALAHTMVALLPAHASALKLELWPKTLSSLAFHLGPASAELARVVCHPAVRSALLAYLTGASSSTPTPAPRSSDAELEGEERGVRATPRLHVAVSGRAESSSGGGTSARAPPNSMGPSSRGPTEFGVAHIAAVLGSARVRDWELQEAIGSFVARRSLSPSLLVDVDATALWMCGVDAALDRATAAAWMRAKRGGGRRSRPSRSLSPSSWRGRGGMHASLPAEELGEEEDEADEEQRGVEEGGTREGEGEGEAEGEGEGGSAVEVEEDVDGAWGAGRVAPLVLSRPTSLFVKERPGPAVIPASLHSHPRATTESLDRPGERPEGFTFILLEDLSIGNVLAGHADPRVTSAILAELRGREKALKGRVKAWSNLTWALACLGGVGPHVSKDSLRTSLAGLEDLELRADDPATEAILASTFLLPRLRLACTAVRALNSLDLELRLPATLLRPLLKTSTFGPLRDPTQPGARRRHTPVLRPLSPSTTASPAAFAAAFAAASTASPSAPPPTSKRARATDAGALDLRDLRVLQRYDPLRAAVVRALVEIGADAGARDTSRRGSARRVRARSVDGASTPNSDAGGFLPLFDVGDGMMVLAADRASNVCVEVVADLELLPPMVHSAGVGASAASKGFAPADPPLAVPWPCLGLPVRLVHRILEAKGWTPCWLSESALTHEVAKELRAQSRTRVPTSAQPRSRSRSGSRAEEKLDDGARLCLGMDGVHDALDSVSDASMVVRASEAALVEAVKAVLARVDWHAPTD